MLDSVDTNAMKQIATGVSDTFVVLRNMTVLDMNMNYNALVEGSNAVSSINFTNGTTPPFISNFSMNLTSEVYVVEHKQKQKHYLIGQATFSMKTCLYTPTQNKKVL